MSEPTLHGMELTPGDEAGLDAAPVCCSSDKARRPGGTGIRFTCGNCRSSVDINELGLVTDIRP
ncbi:hypothetical protein ACGFMM_01485 [Streptomyces sp. NPDC048604]|uniref:hypothetical protein n=1 Tax=Streptomyces sp. NPDC048604 TaxID=3365578 RepID=UPI0037207A37